MGGGTFTDIAKSSYHAFQAKFDWRARGGVSLLSSLTLSRAMDNGAGSLENPNGGSPAPQDFYNMDADWGLSSYHQLAPLDTEASLLTPSFVAAPRPGPLARCPAEAG